MAVPYENVDPIELYKYFPTYTKRRDELAGVDNAGEAILQKITYMLEKETGAHVEMLRRLILDLDVDNCSPSRIDYLGYILGIPIPHEWNDEIRRQYLRQLPGLIKIKGAHLHFAKKAAFYGHDVWLVELWKHEENEDRRYEQMPDAYHQLKSARVDMLACSGSCESVCESTCESGFQLTGAYIQPGVAERILEELGEVLPVHVVLRRQAQFIEPNEFFYPAGDTLGCHTSCESWCEDACESDIQVWPGSYVEANFDDLGPVPRDRWAYQTICVTECESICQTCCECGQQGTCETICEVTCQVVCAGACQSTCQQSCQEVCQASCEVACEAGCQLVCEGICVTSCETLCEADLE